MTPVPQIRTQRLELEPVRSSHADEAWPLADDERMWTYFPQLRPASIEELRRLYAKWERGSPRENEIWWNWLCRELSSGMLAGAMQATVLLDRRLCYVAYAIYPAHQRKGYAREAVAAVMDRVRESFGITRFLAEMDVRNEPSYRLAESLGFSRVQTHGGEHVYELRA